MAAVDPSQFFALSKFFPELTELQSVHVCMLVFGNISIEDLAELREVASDTIKESMNSAQKKLGVTSMKFLRTVVISRVLVSISLYIYKDTSSLI